MKRNAISHDKFNVSKSDSCYLQIFQSLLLLSSLNVFLHLVLLVLFPCGHDVAVVYCRLEIGNAVIFQIRLKLSIINEAQYTQ
jgi:hypothetical protein